MPDFADVEKAFGRIKALEARITYWTRMRDRDGPIPVYGRTRAEKEICAAQFELDQEGL